MPEKDTEDTAKIRVTRKEGEPVVAFSYVDSKNSASTTTFVADPSKNEFSMTPDQALAAVETGGFAVSEKSKSPAENKDTKPLK